MKLHDIPAAIDAAIDFFVDPETGEIKTEEETLAICEALEYERDKKIEWLCKKVINESAELDALTEYSRQIASRIKAKKNSIARLKSYVGYVLDYKKFKSPDALVSVSYRTTKNVVQIDSVADIPDQYFKTPHTESNVDKTGIKEAVLNGEAVPGAHLVDNTAVIIK